MHTKNRKVRSWKMSVMLVPKVPKYGMFALKTWRSALHVILQATHQTVDAVIVANMRKILRVTAVWPFPLCVTFASLSAVAVDTSGDADIANSDIVLNFSVVCVNWLLSTHRSVLHMQSVGEAYWSTHDKQPLGRVVETQFREIDEVFVVLTKKNVKLNCITEYQ